MSRRAATETAPLPALAAPAEDRRGAAAFMALSVIGLSSAVQIRDGLIQPQAVLLLGLSFAACLAAFFLPNLPEFESLGDRPLLLVLGFGLFLSFEQQVARALPGSWHGVEANWRWRFAQVCSGLLITALIALPRHMRTIFALLIATFLLMGCWIIHNVPEPYMDVWMIQTQCLKVFHSYGMNPYAAVYPDAYGRWGLYAEGAIGPDRLVHQGFPYPPIVFWMALPGYWILGDYRYAALLCMAGTAALIAFSRPTRIAKLAAAFFLSTPSIFFVLESGWTEPFSALLLSATVYLACRVKTPSQVVQFPKRKNESVAIEPGPRFGGMAAAMGLFAASKQYLVFAAPLALLLLGRRCKWRELLRPVSIATITALVVSLPLMLWNVSAFKHATSANASAMKFREDAMNFASIFAYYTHKIPSGELATRMAFIAALIGLGVVFYKAPRSPSGFAASVALVYYFFFSVYKFAFCNYFFLMIAACCCAIGSSTAAVEPDLPPQPTGGK